jgi:hypothetical protein
MIKWYLTTNEIDVFHYGSMEEEWQITTGQPMLFFYNTKEELIIALELYGQQYQEPIPIKDITEDTSIEPPIIEPPLPE